MKKLRSYYSHLRHHQTVELKWIFPFTFLTTLTSSDGTPLLPFYRSFSISSSVFIESKLHPLPVSSLPPSPRFAYFISGSNGDGNMLKWTLQAFYHPRTYYVVHLDLESPPNERMDLQNYVSTHPVFVQFGNVKMISKANLVTYRGPTMVANTIHAAAIFLRESGVM